MKTTILIAAIMGVLMLLILPAAADYSGDHPLVPVESGTINGDVLYLVEDGTTGNYVSLTEAPAFPLGTLKPNLTQTFTVSIPNYAKVKSARLYNYYTWSTAGTTSEVPGAPAEADITFSSKTKAKSVHIINPDSCDVTDCDNPIVYTDQDTKQYWDSKGPMSDGAQSWNIPNGNIVVDVTDIVKKGGTYTATIEHASGGNTIKFTTYGLALLIVYEDKKASPISYWITEGADVLWSTLTGFTPEQATTEVLTADSDMAQTAELKVLAAGTEKSDPIQTAILADGTSIGAFPLITTKSLSLFNEEVTFNQGTIFSARDMGDYYTVFNAILVDR